MTEPINLTHGPIKLQALRHDLTDGYEADSYGQNWFVSKEAVLALIDIAEAAHELVSHEDAQRNPTAVLDSGDRLREALARTTTNP